LCGVTDTWEGHGFSRGDFERLNHEIEGWIAAYLPLFGRTNPGAAAFTFRSHQAPAFRP
jgi:hypothetical protein